MGRENEAAGFIAVGDHAKQPLRVFAIGREISPFVEHHQITALQVEKGAFQGSSLEGFGNTHHQPGHREKAYRFARAIPNAVAKCDLPSPTPPKKHEVAVIGDKRALFQVLPRQRAG